MVLAVTYPWAPASSYLSSQSVADSRCNPHATSLFFWGGGLIFPWYIGGRLQNVFCRSAPFYLLRRVATLDLSEWLPNRTQQVGRMAKGPSYMFFYACAGTILHRRLLRFEPTFFGQTAGALVVLVTGSAPIM